MSFTYGGVNTTSLAGVKAGLTRWPSAGGLSLETIRKEGSEGRFYAGQSQERSQFVFDVMIMEATTDGSPRRDNFVGLVDPVRGPRDLILETDSAWKFENVLLADEISWAPLVWDRERGFYWRALVIMETVGLPFAVQVSPAVHTFTGSSSYTLSLGNTASIPTIEFPSGAAATVNLGGFSVQVGATPTGFTNVLDYQNFEFYRRNSSGARVASLVNLMSHFDRPRLELGVSTSLSVTGAPAGTRRLYPNARRK